MGNTRSEQKRNHKLSKQALKKAEILAARRETSISGLLAHEIERLVGNEEAYETSERQAMALLERAFTWVNEFELDGPISKESARLVVSTYTHLVHRHDTS
jgi:hypothetical protein